MIIVLGTQIPNRVRGVLQIWLIEPKPNVFIGDVNKIIEGKIIEFIQPYLNNDSDIMVIRNKTNIQGFDIYSTIDHEHSLVTNNGLILYKHIKNVQIDNQQE